MVHLLPDHGWAMHGTLEAAQKAGAEARFNLKGEQLIKEGDKVVGVYASDEDGNIVRINAKKGVVLSCGDMSSDTEMLTYYAPQATKYGCFFSTMDKSGKPVNTGDGHKMAMWAGAVMEDGPYAPMTHSLGTNSVGIDPFLMVNQDGKRFANEDVGAQELQNAIKRQKGGVSYQIFDSKWKDQIKYMDTGHGNVNWYVESGADVPNGSYGKNAYISDEDNEDGNTPGFLSYFEGEKALGVTANSIAELAKLMEVDEAALTATIERYNELAAAGNDEDFGKRADRLFPVEEGPFYAYPLTDTVILVNMGGLQTDVDFNVMDTEDEVIEGLYAVGNAQGGRFLVDYPLPAPGISHGMALTHGMLVGRILAQL